MHMRRILDTIAMATGALEGKGDTDAESSVPLDTEIQFNDKWLPVLPLHTILDPAPAQCLPSIH